MPESLPVLMGRTSSQDVTKAVKVTNLSSKLCSPAPFSRVESGGSDYNVILREIVNEGIPANHKQEIPDAQSNSYAPPAELPQTVPMSARRQHIERRNIRLSHRKMQAP